MKKMYLLNAFSLQMLDEFPASVEIQELTDVEIRESDLDGLAVASPVVALNAKMNGVEWFRDCPIDSAIGHADTARVLGVECNRVNVRLHKGDVAVVAQLVGGRLPEGATTLPEGFAFKFLRVKVK